MALSLDGSAHSNAVASVATVTLTTSNSDNVIMLQVATNQGPVTSVTSSGLTWSFIAADGTSSISQLEFWYAIASSPLSSHVITVNNTGNGFTTIDAFGVSGVDTSSPFDADASTPATNSSNADLLISTDTADTFIISGYRMSNTASPSQGAGWIKISGANYALSQYQIVSSTQTNLAATIASGSRNGGVALALVKASAGGSIIPQIMHHRRQQQ
jgi:hypothetical protein